MKFYSRTLLNPWVIFCWWLVLWTGRLQLIPDYYQRTYELGYYPPEGDSIATPIVGNAVLTIILAPFFAIVFWLLLRRSPINRRTWFAWNRNRWVVSLVWTVLFLGCALFVLQQFAEDIRIGLLFNVVADLGWFFLWLAVRAVVVSRISDRDSLVPNKALVTANAPMI